MASLDFFGAENDVKGLLTFLFSTTDLRVFESYSDFDQELREFHSVDELSRAFPVGTDSAATGGAILLELWSPCVTRAVTFTRFPVDPKACDGHTFRTRIEGNGLIQLHLGGVHDCVLTKSHFGHNTPKRAKKWGVARGVKWTALGRLSGVVQKEIRRRAIGKADAHPVLPGAFKLASRGYLLKESTDTTWAYDLSTLKTPVQQ